MDSRRGVNGGQGGAPNHRVNNVMDMAVFDSLPEHLRHALNFSANKYGSEQVRDLGADAAFVIRQAEDQTFSQYRARIGLRRRLP